MLAWTCLCLLLHHFFTSSLPFSSLPLFFLCSVPASCPLSPIYTAGCCLFVSIVVLFVCIVSGVDNRPLGSIKDRMAAFQGNGKLCVCVCLCMLPVSACNRMNICMTVCCPPPQVLEWACPVLRAPRAVRYDATLPPNCHALPTRLWLNPFNYSTFLWLHLYFTPTVVIFKGRVYTFHVTLSIRLLFVHLFQ